MPGIVREEDVHIGHASPSPNPFHQTQYVPNLNQTVYVNGRLAIVKGDQTACGDPAVGSSPNVYIGNVLVHRLGDSTGGHGSWVPNSAATSSENVFSNGS